MSDEFQNIYLCWLQRVGFSDGCRCEVLWQWLNETSLGVCSSSNMRPHSFCKRQNSFVTCTRGWSFFHWRKPSPLKVKELSDVPCWGPVAWTTSASVVMLHIPELVSRDMYTCTKRQSGSLCAPYHSQCWIGGATVCLPAAERVVVGAIS